MTATSTPIPTPTDLLDAIGALRDEIVARAPETEVTRRVPADLLRRLLDAGCFRILLPASHGGSGADLTSWLWAVESLSRADGSVGWVTMIGGGSWIDLSTLPRATFDAMFDGRQDVVTAGAFNPTGGIEPVDGGYRITGRWAFASGCEHADWIFGNCVEGVVDGMPLLRGAVFRPEEVVIEDTWDVIGLRGTGSHHVRVEGVVVPAERTFAPLSDPHCIDEPIVRIPPPALFAQGIASVALGIAQGAIDDITAMAGERMPLLAHGPLAVDETFQVALATADTEVRAARALLYSTAESLWATAAAGAEHSLEDRARARAAAVWVAERAEAAVSAAFRAGGSASMYAGSSLQRRLRDVQALRQHFLVRSSTMVTAGALLAGQPLGTPIF